MPVHCVDSNSLVTSIRSTFHRAWLIYFDWHKKSLRHFFLWHIHIWRRLLYCYSAQRNLLQHPCGGPTTFQLLLPCVQSQFSLGQLKSSPLKLSVLPHFSGTYCFHCRDSLTAHMYTTVQIRISTLRFELIENLIQRNKFLWYLGNWICIQSC